MTTYVRNNAEGMTAEELEEYLKMIQQQELTADFGTIPTPDIPTYTPVEAEEFASIESPPMPRKFPSPSLRASPNHPANMIRPPSTNALDRVITGQRRLQTAQLPWHRGQAAEFADPNVERTPVLSADLPFPETSRTVRQPVDYGGRTVREWDSIRAGFKARNIAIKQKRIFDKLVNPDGDLPEVGEPVDRFKHGYVLKRLSNEAYENAIGDDDNEDAAKLAGVQATNRMRKMGISAEERKMLSDEIFLENFVEYFTKIVPQALQAKVDEKEISIPSAHALLSAKDPYEAMNVLLDDPRAAWQIAVSSIGRAPDPIALGILGTVLGTFMGMPITGGAVGVGIGSRQAEMLNGFEEQLRFAGERRGIKIDWNTLAGIDILFRNPEIVEEALVNLKKRANTIGLGMGAVTGVSGVLSKVMFMNARKLMLASGTKAITPGSAASATAGVVAPIVTQAIGEGGVEAAAQKFADEPIMWGAILGEGAGSIATAPIAIISGASGATLQAKKINADNFSKALDRLINNRPLTEQDVKFLADLNDLATKIAAENYPYLDVMIVEGEIEKTEGNPHAVLREGQIIVSLKAAMEAVRDGTYSNLAVALEKGPSHEAGEHVGSKEAEAVSDWRRFKDEIMAWLPGSPYAEDYPMLGQEDVIEKQLADGVITGEQYRSQWLELRRQQKLAAEEFRGSMTTQEYSALWQKAKEAGTSFLGIKPSIKTEVRTRYEKRLKDIKEGSIIPEHRQKFRAPADVESIERTLQDFDRKTVEASGDVYMKVADMNTAQVRYRDQNNFLAKVIRRELNQADLDDATRGEIDLLILRVKNAFGAVSGKKAGVNEALESKFTTQDKISNEYQRLMRLAQEGDDSAIEDSIISYVENIVEQANANRLEEQRQLAVAKYEEEKGAARGYTFEKNVKHVDREKVTAPVARLLLQTMLEEGSIDQATHDQRMQLVNQIASEKTGRNIGKDEYPNAVWGDVRNTKKIEEAYPGLIEMAKATGRLSKADQEVTTEAAQTATSIAEQEAFAKALETKETLDLDRAKAEREAEQKAKIDESKVTRIEPDYAKIAKEKEAYQRKEEKKKSVDASWLGTMEDPTWVEEDQAAQADIDSMSALDYDEYVKEWGDESTMLDGNDVYMKRAGDSRVTDSTDETVGNDAEGRMLGIGDTVIPVEGGEIVQIVGIYDPSEGSAPIPGLEGKVRVEDRNGVGTYVDLEDFKHTDPPAGVTRDRIPKGFADFLKNSGIPLGQFRNPDGKLSVTKLAKNREKWQSKLDAKNKEREAAGEKPLNPGNAIDRPWAIGQSPDRVAANRNEAVTTAMNEAYKEYGVDFINEHMRELVRTDGPQLGHHHPGNYLPLQRVISRAKHAFANNKKYAPEEDVINFESRKNADKPLALMMQWLNGRQTESVKQFKKDHPLWHAFEGAIAILRKGSRDDSKTLEEVVLEGANYLRAHDRHPDAPKGEIPNLGALDAIPTSTSAQIRAGMNHVDGFDVFMKRKKGKKGTSIVTDIDAIQAGHQSNFFVETFSHIFGRPTAAVAAFNRVSPFSLEKGDVPSADVIANKVQVHHSSTMRPDDLKEGTDYIQDVSIKTGELYTGLSRIFSSLTNNVGVLDDKMNAQIVDYLSGKEVKFTNKTVKKAAEDIKELIEGVYQYSKDTTKDLDSPLDLRGDADTTMPRVWNIDFLATQSGKNRFLIAVKKYMGPTGESKLTPNDLYNIVINSGGFVQGEWTNNKPSQVTSKVDIENDERAQEFLDSIPMEALVKSGLVITDLQAVLPRFIAKAVNRTQYSKIFGKNDEILRGLLKSGVEEINAHNEKVLELDEKGRQPKLLDAKKFEKMVWDLSKILRHQYGYSDVGVTTRKNVQRATNTATMLKGVFFTLASIPEFLTPALKKGIRPDHFAVDFTYATAFATYKAMNGISKLLLNKHLPAMRKHSSELTGVLQDAALLREMGVMDIQAMGDTAATRYTNQAFAPGGIRSGARNTLGSKVPKNVRAVFNMQTYMQAIMLTTITEMQQIMALRNFQRHMGKRVGFVKASKGPLKGRQLSKLKQYRQDMLDYGLSADVDLDTAEGQKAFNAGALRFVDQVITRPNDATTAKVFKNPITAPIFLFKRFITTYSNTLLNSVITDIATKVDNEQRAKQIGQVAVTAATMYGAVMFAEIIRGAIKGDLEEDDFKVAPEEFKTFMRRMDRTGLMTAPGAMAANLLAPYKSWGGDRGSDRLVELGGVFASDMKATLDFYLSKKGEKDFNRLFGQLFPTSRMFMDKNKSKKTDKKKRKSNMSYTVAE